MDSKNHYTLNLNKSFPRCAGSSTCKVIEIFRVGPIKLQTQNIIKMKLGRHTPMNYYIKLTLPA